jgi:hypothetical protein
MILDARILHGQEPSTTQQLPKTSEQDRLLDRSFFALNVLAESNINLSLGQKELMLWHCF